MVWYQKGYFEVNRVIFQITLIFYHHKNTNKAQIKRTLKGIERTYDVLIMWVLQQAAPEQGSDEFLQPDACGPCVVVECEFGL